MLTLINVLSHDPDVPASARQALREVAAATPAQAEVLKRRAANTLRHTFDLGEEDVAALLGLNPQRRAA